jgi:hypothetical protein
MNSFTPSTLNLSMATGSGPLTEPEARKFAAYLSDKLPATDPQDQHVVLHLIDGLRALPKPEAAFGDLYRPLGYTPGWVPDP